MCGRDSCTTPSWSSSGGSQVRDSTISYIYICMHHIIYIYMYIYTCPREAHRVDHRGWQGRLAAWLPLPRCTYKYIFSLIHMYIQNTYTHTSALSEYADMIIQVRILTSWLRFPRMGDHRLHCPVVAHLFVRDTGLCQVIDYMYIYMYIYI